jgi:tRNA dimethylallyltransferase
MSNELIQRCFFLLGPTASGKSELAVALAERIGGEIVGADAFQIYAELDLLSAKPSASLRARAPHHLIGEWPLAKSFDVAKYRTLALERIGKILERGRVPIVCGGTGLYVRSLTHGLADMPPADANLRAELEKEPLHLLVARLHALDPAARVDEKNPRRVIRALEVCLSSDRPFSAYRTEWDRDPGVRGAIVTRPHLNERIATRTAAMFSAGVVQEVATTRNIGPTAAQMLGLREIQGHLDGDLSRDECLQLIATATRQYAKRQLTWFRRERGYDWVEAGELGPTVDLLIRIFERPPETATEGQPSLTPPAAS